MSVIRKKPEINKIIDDLTDAEKLKLAQEVNNEAPLYTKSLIRKDYYFSELNNNAYEIAGILLEVAPTNTLPGIVIRTNNSNNLREYFIQFAHKQKLIEWRLNTINRTAEVIDEDLDINELRRLLEEVHDHILATEIDSGSEPANKVLVSDGEGGAEWANAMDTITPETVEEGDAVQLFGFNSQGQLVKDAIPEGITVDQTIIEDSENAVAGGAVYDAVADINAELETKANVDGNYPTMTVGMADNLTPYDESAGDDQDEPFSLQATGTGNGTQPDFSTGSAALMKEKQGNTVVVNQVIPSQTISRSVDNISIVSNNDYYYTITVNNPTGYNQVNLLSGTFKQINGHKYLFGGQDRNNDILVYPSSYSGLGKEYIYVAQTTSNISVYLYVAQTTPNGTYKLRPFVVDLTQWFNGDIPQDILDNPSNFFRYYQGSLAYNEGELVNANGRYIKCIGRQQWDEETESGYIRSADGVKINDSSKIRMKNPIRVIPNTTYYYKTPVAFYICCYDENMNFIKSVGGSTNGTFTTPSNCVFIQAGFESAYGTTYNHDITISIYYEDESGYDQYYPYELLTNNDTGTEVLRSAGSVKDSKAPDGTIHRRIGSYTFTGEESWVAWGSSYYFQNGTAIKAKDYDNNVLPNAVSIIGTVARKDGLYGGTVTNSFAVSGFNVYITGDLYANVSNLTGKTIYFELATPTTEQGTPYSENLVIDDFGSMDFGSDVPQGANIFYPVDYKAFVDTLYKYTDGTPSNIALKSDVSSEQSARESVDTQLLNAVGGTLRQCLCVKESLDFDNTDVVDLGSLTWNYDSANARFFSIFTSAKVPANRDTVASVICTKYKEIDNNQASGLTNVVYLDGGNLYVKDTTYTDATAFKNAMKGVLLAYEKASE